MVAVVDYRMGNTRSVVKTLKAMGYDAVLTAREDELRSASHIILPGVGAFPDGMRNLQEPLGSLGGASLETVLTDLVVKGGRPFLAICIGMQLLASEGTEFRTTPGLGWIPGRVERFHLDERSFKIPHVGWDDVAILGDSSLFNGVPRDKPNFYFVHSFHLKASDPAHVIASGNYGEPFVAAVQRGNIFGTQFHPEKSQGNGVQVLRNFLST